MTNKPPFRGERVRLGDVCKVGSFEPSGDNPTWLLNLDAIEKDTGRILVKQLVDRDSIGTSTVPFNGDCVLYSKLRPNLNKVVLPDGTGWATSELLPLLPNTSKLSREWLACYLRSRSFVSKAVASTAGSKMPRVNRKVVLDAEIPLPILSEQEHAIAQFAAIDQARESTSRLLSLLDDLVKSRFVEMFGNGSYPSLRLDSLADVQGGLTKNSRRDALSLQLPYLRVANVLPGALDLTEIKTIGLSESECEKTLLKAGDILFVEGNGSGDQIGRSALWTGEIDPCVHQNHLIRARCHADLLPLYALHYFNSSHGRAQIVGKAVSTSGLYTLSTGKIKALMLPVPPLALQQEFADFVAEVDKSRLLVQKQINKLQTLYDSLAQDYFG